MLFLVNVHIQIMIKNCKRSGRLLSDPIVQSPYCINLFYFRRLFCDHMISCFQGRTGKLVISACYGGKSMITRTLLT